MFALLRAQCAVQHPLISSTFWQHCIKYSISLQNLQTIYVIVHSSPAQRVISCFQYTQRLLSTFLHKYSCLEVLVLSLPHSSLGAGKLLMLTPLLDFYT